MPARSAARAVPSRRIALYDAVDSSRSTSGSTAWNASTSASMRPCATGSRIRRNAVCQSSSVP